jgi:hypothetical protein
MTISPMSQKSDPLLVVMAAGIGSRYSGLKQIEPIGPGGETILEYSIYDAIRAGFKKVVFIINRDIEKAFRSRIEQTVGRHCHHVYVYQELNNLPAGFDVPRGRQKPWGTAHAVMCCKDVVAGPFAVINADDFYGRSSFQALYAYLNGAHGGNGRYDFCMVGYVLKNTLTEHGHVSRGVCEIDGQGNLVNIHERVHIERFGQSVMYTEDGATWIEIAADCVVSMNMWGFTPALFTELQRQFSNFLSDNRAGLLRAEFFLPEVVNQLLDEKKATVKVLPTQERWFGVTYKQDRVKVKKAVLNLIHEGFYPQALWR